jgi:hypothetical protein
LGANIRIFVISAKHLAYKNTWLSKISIAGCITIHNQSLQNRENRRTFAPSKPRLSEQRAESISSFFERKRFRALAQKKTSITIKD